MVEREEGEERGPVREFPCVGYGFEREKGECVGREWERVWGFAFFWL
jgi:hypothetical protein